MNHRAESTAALVGQWLLALVVPFSALALGSLLPWTLALVTVVSAVSAVLLWLPDPARISTPARLVLAGMGLLFVVTLLQCVPLPVGLLRVIAPMNADVWARSLLAFREPGPRFAPLTLAPIETLLQVLRGILYLSLFLGSIRVMSREGGRTFLERIVILSASAMALVSLAHAAVSAPRVFGIYAPREVYAYVPGRLGPLLNVNHLSAYANLGACVALGAVVGHRPSLPRPLAAAMALLCAGTSVWAGSRGGTGALVLGVGLTLVLAWRVRRRADAASRFDALLPPLVALVGAALVGLGTSDFARADLTNTNLSKFELAGAAAKLSWQAPWFGVGRGAFEAVFPAVQDGYGGASYQTFTHPENLLAQWTTEWGVPVALFAIALFAYALRPKTVLTAALLPIGAWTAIVACVAHDAVDFHTEVPGVTALLVLCVALVVGARKRSSQASSPLEARARVGVFALPLLAVLGAVLVLPHLSHSLAADRAELGRRVLDKDVKPSALRAELRQAILRHPADAFFPLMGAIAKVDGETVPWVGQALERNPSLGRAHLVLARGLGPRHAAQARLEYRLAYEQDAALRSVILAEAPRLVTDATSALELAPEGADGEAVLDRLADLLLPAHPEDAAKLDEELTRRNPNAKGPYKRKAASLLAKANAGAASCADSACVKDGLEAAKELVRLDPETCAPRVLLAKFEALLDPAQGKHVALDGLKKAIDEVSDRGACSRAFVVLALDYGDRMRADLELERVVRAGCGSQVECFDLYTWAARTEEARRNIGHALALYRRALEVDPDHYELVAHLAELAERTGLYGEAIDAFNMLARRHPEEPKWAKRVEELKTKALAKTLPGE